MEKGKAEAKTDIKLQCGVHWRYGKGKQSESNGFQSQMEKATAKKQVPKRGKEVLLFKNIVKPASPGKQVTQRDNSMSMKDQHI